MSIIRSILVVEDYPAAMLVNTMMIESMGYRVEPAVTGLQAIEKLRNTSTPFMAILMDVNMPDMDGFEVTKTIREMDCERGVVNTIIAMTAHALAGDRARCLNAGMDDYMTKPVAFDILEQKLMALAQAMP